MELVERLSDAAFRGDVVALADLLAQDPNILDKNYLRCEDKNVLHVAAILGNEEFFQAVLRANSSLCHEMCLARDRVGRNPIHAAASHGKLDILNLIKDHDWLAQAALEKTDNGGTILHLCVKHDQLDALRLLLGIFTNPGIRMAKNEDDMTILHLAFYYNQNQKRREVIIYLINNVAKIVDLRNANGQTALDLFFREAKVAVDTKELMFEYDKEMAHSLVQASAHKGRDISNKRDSEWFEKRRDAMMVVASLIATMAFQAMISPPGGTWQDDLLEGDNPHRVGESVMAQTHPKYYNQLIKANTVAFVSSLSIIIILLVRGIGIKANNSIVFFIFSTCIMWLSVTAISVVYSISLVAIVPESARGSNLNAPSYTAIILIMVWSLVIYAVVHLRFKRSRKHAMKRSISNNV